MSPTERAQWCHAATHAECETLRMKLRELPPHPQTRHLGGAGGVYTDATEQPRSEDSWAWLDAMREAEQIHAREMLAHAERARLDYVQAHAKRKRGEA